MARRVACGRRSLSISIGISPRSRNLSSSATGPVSIPTQQYREHAGGVVLRRHGLDRPDQDRSTEIFLDGCAIGTERTLDPRLGREVDMRVDDRLPLSHDGPSVCWFQSAQTRLSGEVTCHIDLRSQGQPVPHTRARLVRRSSDERCLADVLHCFIRGTCRRERAGVHVRV